MCKNLPTIYIHSLDPPPQNRCNPRQFQQQHSLLGVELFSAIGCSVRVTISARGADALWGERWMQRPPSSTVEGTQRLPAAAVPALVEHETAARTPLLLLLTPHNHLHICTRCNTPTQQRGFVAVIRQPQSPPTAHLSCPSELAGNPRPGTKHRRSTSICRVDNSEILFWTAISSRLPCCTICSGQLR